MELAFWLIILFFSIVGFIIGAIRGQRANSPFEEDMYKSAVIVCIIAIIVSSFAARLSFLAN
jgi:hypothetical protein